MLVLTRKIGQQIVLPDQGITIDVVDVGKTHVRLGIAAPRDVPVHRSEVWNRAHATDNGSPASNDNPPDRLVADEPETPTAPAPSSAGLGQCLALWIAKRTGGRIRHLSVETRDDQIVIRGSARSFYARQLAQAAVQEVFDLCDGLPPRSVEYRILIGDDASTGFRQ
jgi:carbon storage regulator